MAEAVAARAGHLGIRDIVVASNQGEAARAILAALGRDKATSDKVAEFNVVVVSHHAGFREPGGDEMGPTVRSELAAAGARVLTTTHLFAGVERGVMRKFQGLYPAGIIANTLRLFGQGTKVAVEVAVMALDAGLIPFGRDIIAVGGTGRGADTALVIRPAHSNDFFATNILEHICRPRPKD